MMSQSKMQKCFWGEAILNATYVMNRSPSRALEVDKTPAELWFSKRPDLSNVRIFGSIAYAHVPDATRGKLDDKSKRMLMQGYAKNGYRLWNPESSTVAIRRNVVFDETQLKHIDRNEQNVAVREQPDDDEFER